MNKALGRISLAAFVVLGLTGAALAREAAHAGDGKDKGFTGKGFARKGLVMPKYQADARVSGPDLPYSWPVTDRYRPVSQPFYGRAY